MTLEQQRDVLEKTHKMLTEFCGKPPRGSVAPWWETSKEGVDLMLSYGIEYDHSMSHDDCHMYWLRTNDSWTKIDYTKKAETWMKPLVKGKDTGLVEIPANWYLDEVSFQISDGRSRLTAIAVCSPHHMGRKVVVDSSKSLTVYSLPPMMFVKNSPNSHGWVNSRDVEDLWRDHFDYFYREYADDPDEICVFPITCHPDVSGRPHVLLMHER
jgi:peptidoglycan/xylan/chitin deacetylase (PgdA/CDA1 family)